VKPIEKALRLAAVIAMTAGGLGAQAKHVPAKEPHDGYMFNPLVIADAGCVRDVARAANQGGVEQRKATEDLVKYGCLKQMKGIFTAFLGSHPERITVAGVAYVNAGLMFDIKEMQVLDPNGELPAPEDSILSGFVLESKIDPVTPEQLMAKLLNEKKKREEKIGAESTKP
jgi:hypothetical protein